VLLFGGKRTETECDRRLGLIDTGDE
jgi:hypothetical protein